MEERIRVKVLIVDDDALVRSGLTTMLDGADGINVVGTASDGTDVEAAVREHTPDVVLMDIRMPNLDGITATKQLVSHPNTPRVIVLTTFDSDELVVEALRAGASGFLVKDTPPQEIVESILRVASGDAALSASVTKQLIGLVVNTDETNARQHARDALDTLTDRERDVAIAVGNGASNQEIATGLFMSVATVKAHVSRILEKLAMSSRVQLALLVHDAAVES
jgi:DNA-binding NarL/FixJ family response regulator